MHKAAGDFMAEWNRAIKEDERALDSLKPAKKRPEDDIDESTLEDVRGAWENDTIGKLKVADLKQYAKFHGKSFLPFLWRLQK